MKVAEAPIAEGGHSSEPLGLRARQRIELRERIDRVALTLFAERGYEAVTVEEIAGAVGISLSTLFRHVARKEILLTGVLRSARAAILRTFAEDSRAQPVGDALAAAILRRTVELSEEREMIALWRRAMQSAPERVRRASLLSDDERAALVVLVGERMGLDPEADVRPGALVRARLAAAEHAYERWLAGSENLHELTRQALDVTAPRGT